MFGNILQDPPPLHTWRYPLGVLAYEAIDCLLGKIERGDVDASSIVMVLRSCVCPTERVPLDLSNFSFLATESWDEVLRVLKLIRVTQGLRREDFKDGGIRFARLVLKGSD